jgi:hypothetical protein
VVHREPVQPRPEVRVSPEGVEFLPGPDEHFLHEILGLLGPGHAHGQRVHAAYVVAIQALEGFVVADRRATDVGPFGVCRHSVALASPRIGLQ